MPTISSTPVNVGSNEYRTTYEGDALTSAQTFSFSTTQERFTLFNIGTDTIRMTINGRIELVGPKQTYQHNGLIDEIELIAEKTVPFRLQATTFKSVGSQNIKSRIIVSNKGNVKQDIVTTITERTSRIKYTALCDFHSPSLVFQNVLTASNTLGDLPNTNAVMYAAAIEYEGSIYPASYLGQATVSVAGGQTLEFEPIPISITKGSVYWVRAYTKVNTGENTPVNYSGSSGQGEGYIDGENRTLYNSAAISGVNGSMSAPVAIIGTVNKPTVSVGLVGDSIMHGLKDYSYLGYGYRFCEANSFPHLNAGFPGERLVAFIKAGKRIRQNLFPYLTHVIVEYPVNDLSNGATVADLKTNLLLTWNYFYNMGITVIQTTTTPSSTSSNSFATVGNQTVGNTGFTGGANSKRAELNRWIRTVPYPLSGVIDAANAVESSPESGLWKANGTANYYTDDGLHPKGPGHDLILAVIDPTLFQI